MTNFVKKLESDFSSGFNISLLFETVKNDTYIGQIFDRIEHVGHVVYIVFHRHISDDEKQYIMNLLNNHTVENIVSEVQTPNNINISLNKQLTISSTFEKFASVIFPGSSICKIKTCVDIDVDNVEYTIKIESQNKVMLEKIMTNTSMPICDLGFCENVPFTECLVSAYIKCNNESTYNANIHCLCFMY